MISRRTFTSALAAGAMAALAPRLTHAENGPGARNIVLVAPGDSQNLCLDSQP